MARRGLGLPGNSQRPSPGSLLARWLERTAPHPDTFVCGVRVVAGEVAGEGGRWRYRRSAVDRLVVDGVTVLHHGPHTVLRLRLGAEPTPAGAHRPGYVVWSAVEQTSGAQLLVSCEAGHADVLQP